MDLQISEMKTLNTKKIEPEQVFETTDRGRFLTSQMDSMNSDRVVITSEIVLSIFFITFCLDERLNHSEINRNT